MADAHHRVLVVGGGTAGITTASALRRKGVDDIAIIEPSTKHYYQPLFTLVGGGIVSTSDTVKDTSAVMPSGVKWIQGAAADINPDDNSVALADGTTITYDYLVVAPGIQLDFDEVAGLTDTLGSNGVSTNYDVKYAPQTWDYIKDLKGGSAIFTMPTGPIKCAGAPQKIAYLAADYWREQGVLDNIDVHLVLSSGGMFGVEVFKLALEKVVEGYGINVHYNSHLTAVDGSAKKATISPTDDEGEAVVMDFDIMHVTPPQSAPDWIKSSKVADASNPKGWVEVDKNSMQHTRYANVFSLGDASSAPNSKTGAAIRKQAPVVVENLISVMDNAKPSASYGGYASCPLTTARNRMLLAEFDYTGEPTPTLPVDTTKPRYDMWLLKRYGLPFFYWNMMLKGRT